MALTSTLLQLRNETRARGGYRRSTALTDEILNNFINDGIAAVHAFIVKKNQDFLLKRTNPDLVTVAGVDTVALPTDFLKLRSNPLKIVGSSKAKILPFDIDEESWVDDDAVFGWGEVGYRYMLQAGFLRLLPAPTAVDTIRLWYIPHYTRLVADGDLYDGIAGADDLVIEHALLHAAGRDRRQSAHADNIAAMERRLMIAIEARNQAEPEYVVDMGRGIPLYGRGMY